MKDTIFDRGRRLGEGGRAAPPKTKFGRIKKQGVGKAKGQLPAKVTGFRTVGGLRRKSEEEPARRLIAGRRRRR